LVKDHGWAAPPAAAPFGELMPPPNAPLELACPPVAVEDIVPWVVPEKPGTGGRPEFDWLKLCALPPPLPTAELVREELSNPCASPNALSGRLLNELLLDSVELKP
jgi:hypothetical protein